MSNELTTILGYALSLIGGLLLISKYFIKSSDTGSSSQTSHSPPPSTSRAKLSNTKPKNESSKDSPQDQEADQQPPITINIGNTQLTLTAEQAKVLKEALNQQDQTPLLITGPAGTGKSVVIHALTHYLKDNNIPFAIVAPTGLAALQVKGQTIHRFFGFKPRLLRYNELTDITIFRNEAKRKLLNNLEYIIIDEISMVRADLMDAIDLSLRRNRNSKLPFGGVKIIMVGDVLQLEPVVKDDADLKQYLTDTWESPFFFHANVWKQTPFKVKQLTKIMRQHDEQFINYLLQLRQGNLEYLELLNILVREQKTPNRIREIQYKGTRLAFTNKVAAAINSYELRKLPNTERVYSATIKGEFKPKDAPVQSSIVLKPGAKVIIMANSPKGEYINGDMGIVTDLWPNTVEVKLFRNNQVVSIAPHKWESLAYEYDPESKQIIPKVIGEFIQMPVRLAWAITVHKSQGLTLDAVTIETRRKRAFAHGQMYVALTRTRSADSLYYDRPLDKSDFIIKSEVLRFLEEVGHTPVWSLQQRII